MGDLGGSASGQSLIKWIVEASPCKGANAMGGMGSGSTRVAIMGSGAIGGVMGARLTSAGADVLYLARGAHLAAIQSKGLLIRGETELELRGVDATDDPTDRPPVDYIIFAVKGPDTESAAALIRPLVGKSTAIATFQNGVEGIDILARHYGSNAVLPGTTMLAAMIEAPGVVRHVSTVGPSVIGEWDGQKTGRVEKLSGLFGKAGLDLKIAEDAHVAVWSKFVAMAAMSAITCLTRLPIKAVVTNSETHELVQEAMDEVIAVAKARGVVIDPELPSKIFAAVSNIDPGWKTSMCNDLEAGRRIEVDSISGSLHRLGRKLGVPTPVHSVAYRALKPYTMPTS